MVYRADKLIEKALALSAKAIADARIKRADIEKQWTMGKKTTKAEKRVWLTKAYFPKLMRNLDELRESIRTYIRENRQS